MPSAQFHPGLAGRARPIEVWTPRADDKLAVGLADAPGADDLNLLGKTIAQAVDRPLTIEAYEDDV